MHASPCLHTEHTAPYDSHGLTQVAFEDLGAKALAACTAPELALRWQASLRPDALCSQAGAGIVVDAGFSFIHIVPFLDNRVRCCCSQSMHSAVYSRVRRTDHAASRIRPGLPCGAQILEDGVRRIDLGGKFMTNYLKELVSFRCLPACLQLPCLAH